MDFIDTHTHLYKDEFDEDQNEVVQRALDAGIKKFVLPAIDSTTTRRMYDLKAAYPENMFLMTGLHPVSVGKDYEKELAHVRNELENREFYAIGEIGIDLHWDRSTLKEQQDAFRRQIQWAKQYKLPIVIHCRDAFDEVFKILEEEKGGDLFGIFHCFTGTLEQAEHAISLGLHLGIGGILTFKNGKIDKFMDKISLTHIVLETDAPYLAPTPYRGKRNESSYMIKVAEKLASIHEMGCDEIARITTQNAKRIFKI